MDSGEWDALFKRLDKASEKCKWGYICNQTKKRINKEREYKDHTKMLRREPCNCDKPWEQIGTDEHIYCGNCNGVITYRVPF